MSSKSVRSRPLISYAQNGEDVLLHRLFADHVGTYVDVGAHHPITDSNTCFLHQRGWHGTNLEPLPHLHRLLVEHRPADLNLAVATSDAAGMVPFYEVTDCVGLSTLSADVAKRHRQRGLAVRVGQVPRCPLRELIAEWHVAAPDVFSLDVEGHEQAVLSGVPWSSWRPRVLIIESTAPLETASSHQAWEPQLLDFGYHFVTFNGVNRFYLRDDVRQWRELLQVPPNALDGFVRYETAVLHERIRTLEARLREHRLPVQ